MGATCIVDWIEAVTRESEFQTSALPTERGSPPQRCYKQRPWFPIITSTEQRSQRLYISLSLPSRAIIITTTTNKKHGLERKRQHAHRNTKERASS